MKAIILTFMFFTLNGCEDIYARAVKYWFPDELTDKSTLVCDGLVLDVTPHFPNLISKMRLYSTQIKVLSVLKGTPVDTLEFHYYVYEPWLTNFDGPCNVSLTKGDKCRFYLNKDPKENYYWGCLEGEFDNSQSVGAILVPDSAEDAKLRFNEIMHNWQDLDHSLPTAMQSQGKPGFETARDDVVSNVLKLVLKCESLKKADIDQKKVVAAEDDFIGELASWKDLLFSDPNDTVIFDKLINDNLPDQTIRAYVVKHLIMEWDKYPNH